MTTVPETARAVLDLAWGRPPTLGSGRLVCVDGPSGAGKTTLSAALVSLTPTVTVVHMDDLYEGWGGLPTVERRLRPLLEALAEDRVGSYRRWDWHADRWAEEVEVAPTPLLVVEGVGAGSLATAGWVTVLVWVEAAYDVRRRRGLARDGDAFAPHWERWATAEAEHFALHRTRERADLVVEGGR